MNMQSSEPMSHRTSNSVPKPKNTFGTIKRLFSYMKKSYLLMVLSILIAAAGTFIQVISPKMLGNCTTIIFNGMKSSSGIDFQVLGKILMFVAVLYAGVFLTSFLQQRVMVVVSQKTTYILRNELKSKMNRVPVSYFDKNQNGMLMSIASNDVDHDFN